MRLYKPEVEAQRFWNPYTQTMPRAELDRLHLRKLQTVIAYAYAQAYRDDVSHLVVVDAPLPGTAVFDRLRADRLDRKRINRKRMLRKYRRILRRQKCSPR